MWAVPGSQKSTRTSSSQTATPSRSRRQTPSAVLQILQLGLLVTQLASVDATMPDCVAAAVSACSGVTQPGDMRGVQLFSTLCPANCTALWGGGGVAIAQGSSASIRFAPPPGCANAYCDLPMDHLRLALQALPPFYMPSTRGTAVVQLTIRVGRYFLYPYGDPNGAPGSVAFVHFNDSAVVSATVRVPAVPTIFRIDMRGARYYGDGVGYVQSSSSGQWFPYFIPGEMKLIVEATTIAYDVQYARVPQNYVAATPAQIMWLLAPACDGAGVDWSGSMAGGTAPPPPTAYSACSALLGLDIMPGCPATTPCDILRDDASVQPLWRRLGSLADEEQPEPRTDAARDAQTGAAQQQLFTADAGSSYAEASAVLLSRRLTTSSQRWWPDVCLDGGNRDRWGCTDLLPAVELAAAVPCDEVSASVAAESLAAGDTAAASSATSLSGSGGTSTASWYFDASAPEARQLEAEGKEVESSSHADSGEHADSEAEAEAEVKAAAAAEAAEAELEGALGSHEQDAIRQPMQPELDIAAGYDLESTRMKRALTSEADTCCHVSTARNHCPQCPSAEGGSNPLNPFPGADNTLTASYIAPSADAACVVDSNNSDTSIQAEALLVFPAPCTRCTLLFTEAWLALASSCSSIHRITATLGFFTGPFWRSSEWPFPDYACARSAFVPAAPGCETALFVPRNVSAYSPLSLACDSAGNSAGVRISVGDSADIDGWGSTSPPWLALRLQSSSGCFTIGGGLQPYSGGDAWPTCPHNHFHGYCSTPITPVGLLLPLRDGQLSVGAGWLPSPATPGLFLPAAVEPWSSNLCPSQTPRPSSSTPQPHNNSSGGGGGSGGLPSAFSTASPSPTHGSWSGGGGNGGGTTGGGTTGGGTTGGVDYTWGAHDRTDICQCRLDGIPPMGSLTPISGAIIGLPYPPNACSLRIFICVNDNPNQWWSKPGIGPAAVVPLRADGSFYLPGWATGAGDAAFTHIRICVIPPGNHDMQDALGGPVPDSVLRVAIGVATFTRDGVAVTVAIGGGAGGGAGGLLTPSKSPSHTASRSRSASHTRTRSATATHSKGWHAPSFLTGEGPYGPTSAAWWDETGGGPSYDVGGDGGVSGISAAAASGIAVAAVIVFAILLVVAIVLWRKPRRRERRSPPVPPPTAAGTQAAAGAQQPQARRPGATPATAAAAAVAARVVPASRAVAVPRTPDSALVSDGRGSSFAAGNGSGDAAARSKQAIPPTRVPLRTPATTSTAAGAGAGASSGVGAGAGMAAASRPHQQRRSRSSQPSLSRTAAAAPAPAPVPSP